MYSKREAKAAMKWMKTYGHYVRQCPTLSYQENRLCAMEMYWVTSLAEQQKVGT